MTVVRNKPLRYHSTDHEFNLRHIKYAFPCPITYSNFISKYALRTEDAKGRSDVILLMFSI